MSDRRRKAVVDSLTVYKDFIAAGFRSPDLVERTIARLPREPRDVMRRFTADFERVLTACDMQQQLGSNSPSGDRAQSPISRQKQMAAASTVAAVAPKAGAAKSAAKAFKFAIIGARAVAPDVTAIDTFIPSTAHKPGLIHGDVTALHGFLNAYPAVERFLAKQLVDVEDLFVFGEDSAADVLDAADSLKPANGSPVAPDATDDVDHALHHAPLSVMDAFAQASMLWTQTHPVDLAALARDRAAAMNSSVRTTPPRMEDLQNMLLRCNLELRYPKAAWEMLLLARDASRQELAVLDEEVASSDVGADVTSESLAVATCGRLRIAISNCRDGLANIGASSSPQQIKETITLRLTHLLADVTSIVHDAGIVLGASGATVAPAAPVKQSLLQRLQNKAKPDTAKAEEDLEAVGKLAYAISQTAKRHIKFMMQPMETPSSTAAESVTSTV